MACRIIASDLAFSRVVTLSYKKLRALQSSILASNFALLVMGVLRSVILLCVDVASKK